MQAELTAVLESFEGVRAARLIVVGKGASARQVALLVPANGEVSLTSLRRWLRMTAPTMAVPDEFVIVPSIPAAAEADVLIESISRKRQGPPYIKPRNLVEAYLIRLWGEALPVATISVFDDFFALGGHSLLAARLLHTIECDLNVRIDFNMVQRNTVLADLAAALIAAGVEPPSSLWQENGMLDDCNKPLL